jgi:hypothetical protein
MSATEQFDDHRINEISDVMSEIGTLALIRTKVGTWSAHIEGVEIKNGSILSTSFGNGTTPSLAIQKYWSTLTSLDEDQRIVTGAYRSDRKEYRLVDECWIDMADVPAPTFG